jgi:hypothetical protein
MALRAGRPPFTPREIPGTHFCYRLSRPPDHRAAGMIRSIEKSNDLIGNRTRALPVRSIVPQPTTLPRAPVTFKVKWRSCVEFKPISFCERSHEHLGSLRNDEFLVWFVFLAAVAMRRASFWDVTPCNLVQVHGVFGGTYYVLLQGRQIREAARSLLGCEEHWLLGRDVSEEFTTFIFRVWK